MAESKKLRLFDNAEFGQRGAIFLFNGPPRSGKDTAVDYCYNHPSCAAGIGMPEKFARPLKRAFAATFNTRYDPVTGSQKTNWGYDYEAHKDEIIPFLGCSYRQWQIDYSEKYMKPMYGVDIFGRLLVDRLRNIVPPCSPADEHPPEVIPTQYISDSGFAEEAIYLAREFGEENVLLVRCHRPGCDFTGDSRSYLYGILPNETDVVNDSSLDEYHGKIRRVVRDFIHRRV